MLITIAEEPCVRSSAQAKASGSRLRIAAQLN